MAHVVGAAPYVHREPSLWARLVAWWRGPGPVIEPTWTPPAPPHAGARVVTVEERIAAIGAEQARAASNAALQAPLRAPYAPSPAKSGPRPPPTPTLE
jgi:hypothetical protein